MLNLNYNDGTLAVSVPYDAVQMLDADQKHKTLTIYSPHFPEPLCLTHMPHRWWRQLDFAREGHWAHSDVRSDHLLDINMQYLESVSRANIAGKQILSLRFTTCLKEFSTAEFPDVAECFNKIVHYFKSYDVIHIGANSAMEVCIRTVALQGLRLNAEGRTLNLYTHRPGYHFTLVYPEGQFNALDISEIARDPRYLYVPGDRGFRYYVKRSQIDGYTHTDNTMPCTSLKVGKLSLSLLIDPRFKNNVLHYFVQITRENRAPAPIPAAAGSRKRAHEGENQNRNY